MASLKNTGINWNQQGIIFQYVPIFFKLAHSFQCIFCAFWVGIDMHCDFFADFEIKK